MGNCSGEERALIEILVVIILVSAIGMAIIWRSVLRVLRVEREVIALRGECLTSREGTTPEHPDSTLGA